MGRHVARKTARVPENIIFPKHQHVATRCKCSMSLCVHTSAAPWKSALFLRASRAPRGAPRLQPIRELRIWSEA